MKKNDIDPSIILFFAVLTIIVIISIISISSINVNAESDIKHVSFAECNACLSEYIYKNGMLSYEWEVVYEQQRADQLQRLEKTVTGIVESVTKEHFKNIFGYIPDAWEIGLLKRALTAECGYTEPDIGVERVLCVIGNRCRRDDKTIYEVLSARGQFEIWSNGRIQRAVPSEQVERVTRQVIDSGELSDRSVMYFTVGKYNPYCRPAYVIGHHYFGY